MVTYEYMTLWGTGEASALLSVLTAVHVLCRNNIKLHKKIASYGPYQKGQKSNYNLDKG